MREFIEWLIPGELIGYYIELRTIGEMGYRKQRFYRQPDGIDRLLADARCDDDAGLEVYIGVLPRHSEGGTAAHTTEWTRLLWADVDAKHHGDSKSRALAAILDFPVPPSVIVDSGGGYHAYWELDRDHHFDTVQPIMKGIAQRIGGDHVYDRARILRLPGLSNHKHGGNAPVRLIRFDTTLTYRLSDLAEYEYREPKVPHYKQVYRDLTRSWDLMGWNPAFDPGKGARSENDFRVICGLIRCDWSDDDIERVFIEHPQGIGAKTAKQGLRYLERTIRKAHQAVGR